MGLRRFYLIMLKRVSVGAAPSPHRPTGTPAHHGRRGQSGRRGGRHSARGRHRTPSISRCRALPPQFASLAPMRGPRSAEYRALHVLAPAARTASRVRRGRLPGLLHSARPRPSASCSPRAPPPFPPAPAVCCPSPVSVPALPRFLTNRFARRATGGATRSAPSSPSFTAATARTARTWASATRRARCTPRATPTALPWPSWRRRSAGGTLSASTEAPRTAAKSGEEGGGAAHGPQQQ